MRLLLATNNLHKLREIREILTPLAVEVLSLKDINLAIEIEEDADTLQGNAIKKSSTIFNITKITTIADDTGLMVDCLSGRPGVYSARYAGEGCSYDDNNIKLLDELKFYPKPWKAKFVSCISIFSNDYQELFIGECFGQIVEDKKGSNGFGYDPVFMAEGFERTYAELSSEEKNKISHRAKAVKKLYNFLKNSIC